MCKWSAFPLSDGVRLKARLCSLAISIKHGNRDPRLDKCSAWPFQSHPPPLCHVTSISKSGVHFNLAKDHFAEKVGFFFGAINFFLFYILVFSWLVLEFHDFKLHIHIQKQVHGNVCKGYDCKAIEVEYSINEKESVGSICIHFESCTNHNECRDIRHGNRKVNLWLKSEFLRQKTVVCIQ